ncbi:hypothetical protein T439DRAFT_326014 [Meredithblackwellia eburnea MCA 4105]
MFKPPTQPKALVLTTFILPFPPQQRSQRFTVQTSPAKPQSQAPSVPSLPFQPPPPPVQAQSVGIDPFFAAYNSGALQLPPVASQTSQPEPAYSDDSDPSSPLRHHSHHLSSTNSGYNTSTSIGTSSTGTGTTGTGYGSVFSSPASFATSNSMSAGTAGSSYGSGGGAGLRAGLPTEWMGRGGGVATGASPGFEYEGASGQLPQAVHAQRQRNYEQSSGYAALMGRPPILPTPEDEIIPTAIVIKNISFQVPKETLLGIMEDLNLPPPFAFNYHYDNGQFRGLAFANYRQAGDAALVATALNGFDLQGRKLRTEFKKVLKEGEKERIERDKALKRMRSQQQLTNTASVVSAVDNLGPPLPGSWNRREASAPGGYGAGPSAFEDEDYGRQIPGGAFTSAFTGRPPANAARAHPIAQTNAFGVPGGFVGDVMGSYGVPMPNGGPGSGTYSNSPPSDVGTSISARMAPTSSGSGSEGGSKPELDLNDPQALEIYSRVLLFKDDSLRDELAFARSLSPHQRRTVHLVAQKLGLQHRSVGEGDDRHVVVFKAGAGPPAPKPLRHSSSTLGRHASRDFLSSPPPNPFGYTPSHEHSHSPGLARGKKSLPDLRGSSTSSAGPSGTFTTPRRPIAATVGRSSASRTSVMGIFNQFDSPLSGNLSPSPSYPSPAASISKPDNTPFLYLNSSGSVGGSPTPALLQTEDDTTGSGVQKTQGFAMRQPRGPGEDTKGGFWQANGGGLRGPSPSRLGTDGAGPV